MALFGSGRDASFVRGINRELVNRIVDNEVAIYKIDLNSMDPNIYNESSQKSYFQPVRLSALILKGSKENRNEDTGIEYAREMQFGFVKPDLRDIGLVIQEGDIISWDNRYFEVHFVRGSQYWGNKNPSTDLGNTLKETPEFGYGVSVIAECHTSRQTTIQISDVRVGNNSPIRKNSQRNRDIYN